MSISLNNHESRITALENKGTGSWSTGGSNNSYWARESSTGLTIQWGYVSSSQGGSKTVSLSRPFSNTSYSAIVVRQTTNFNTGAYVFPTKVGTRNVSSFTMYANTESALWIAIGILYTYRYIIKSLLIFTPLRKIGGVK